jgi:hypothetical protein
MRENIDLIRNINQLRKKLKEIKFNHKSNFYKFRRWKQKIKGGRLDSTRWDPNLSLKWKIKDLR